MSLKALDILLQQREELDRLKSQVEVLQKQLQHSQQKQIQSHHSSKENTISTTASNTITAFPTCSSLSSSTSDKKRQVNKRENQIQQKQIQKHDEDKENILNLKKAIDELFPKNEIVNLKHYPVSQEKAWCKEGNHQNSRYKEHTKEKKQVGKVGEQNCKNKKDTSSSSSSSSSSVSLEEQISTLMGEVELIEKIHIALEDNEDAMLQKKETLSSEGEGFSFQLFTQSFRAQTSCSSATEATEDTQLEFESRESKSFHEEEEKEEERQENEYHLFKFEDCQRRRDTVCFGGSEEDLEIKKLLFAVQDAISDESEASLSSIFPQKIENEDRKKKEKDKKEKKKDLIKNERCDEDGFFLFSEDSQSSFQNSYHCEKYLSVEESAFIDKDKTWSLYDTSLLDRVIINKKTKKQKKKKKKRCY